MELTLENYHSVEARKEYMGSTQFKDFCKCEKEALAKVNGEYEEPTTDALLFGSYVDAYFSGTLEEFIIQHPELFTRTGELKATFKNAEKVIEAIENDPQMLKACTGEQQVIMTGVIAGVKFKIAIDSYLDIAPEKRINPNIDKVIVDRKVIKDFDGTWVEVNGRNVKLDFVMAYRYDIQGAIYQEVERQWVLEHRGIDRRVPFVLAPVTKEEVPDKALIKLDQDVLDAALQEVIEKAPRFDAIKKGKITPQCCGKCNVCRKNKKVEGVTSYKKFFGEEEEIIY